ncbi:hypothetical protein LINGRAHAP2_LOCUS19454 [Linum grandiflorum]
MEIAWEAGIHNLAIQSESSCTIQLLMSPNIGDHIQAALVMTFRELQQRAWTINISLVY